MDKITCLPKYESDVRLEAGKVMDRHDIHDHIGQKNVIDAVRHALFRKAIEPILEMKMQVFRLCPPPSIYRYEDGSFHISEKHPPQPFKGYLDQLDDEISRVARDYGYTFPQSDPPGQAG